MEPNKAELEKSPKPWHTHLNHSPFYGTTWQSYVMSTVLKPCGPSKWALSLINFYICIETSSVSHLDKKGTYDPSTQL